MTRGFGVLVVALVLSAGCLTSQATADARLEELYAQHRWFELRDAIAGRAVPPLYAGAVAAAFNRTEEAEALLRRAILGADTAKVAAEARDTLANIYLRVGRSEELVRLLDDIIAASPDRADAKSLRDGFEPLRQGPNQAARVGQQALFKCTVTDEGIRLPASVNGHAVEWLFDSGFSNTALSAGEAEMLGITVHQGSINATDFAQRTETRTAVADRIEIGDAELRHVPLLVFDDGHPMLSDEPPGKRGILALPIAIALQGIAWTVDGACRMGVAIDSTKVHTENLAFDNTSPPVVRIPFENRSLDLTLDTGAQGGSQFWQRFATGFASIVAAGTPGTFEVRQVGGVRQQRVVLLRDLLLALPGRAVSLQPARVLTDADGDGFHHGNLGMDVFRQMRAVTFDFRHMVIAFE